MSATSHDYSGDFFEYINAGSIASAHVVTPIVCSLLTPSSLLDVGCGAGAWCMVWRESGVERIIGVDGEYVDRKHLLMPAENFHAHDLTKPFDLDSTFDLVTSLEVAEHIPEKNAEVFVDNLVKHGKLVLFSAAVPGQGGEFHVNEQPLEYWRQKFFARGYRCFDPLRSRIVSDVRVEPWYRYNTLLYVAGDMVSNLAREVLITELATDQPISELAPVKWRLRRTLIRSLPRAWTDQLVQLKHSWVRAVHAREANRR